ncbi:hypothetical protein WJX77_007349 [Trebouxia sp. C0004]
MQQQTSIVTSRSATPMQSSLQQSWAALQTLTTDFLPWCASSSFGPGLRAPMIPAGALTHLAEHRFDLKCTKALTQLAVVFHMQRQQPPILPPLYQLYQQQPTKAEGASLRAGQQSRKVGLGACRQMAHRELMNMGAANKSSLAELLLSFFVLHQPVRSGCMPQTWASGRGRRKHNCFGMVEPYITDKCARTTSRSKTPKLARKFNEAAQKLT